MKYRMAYLSKDNNSQFWSSSGGQTFDAVQAKGADTVATAVDAICWR